MSRRLVLGSVSRQRLAGLCPLGIVDGREVFPIHGAEDDTDSTSSGDDTDDDEDNSDEDSTDDDDSDAKDDKDKSKTRRSRQNSRSSEFTRIKRENAKLLREQQARDKADREAELKGKSEVERATAERDDAVKERDSLKEQLAANKVELEIIRLSHKKHDWADIEDVLNDKALRRAIEIGEDGEISGVTEALKDLAKRKPHFLAKSSEDTDDKGGKNSNGRQTATNGNGNGKSGSNPNGASGDKNNRQADRDRLAETYPILGRS